MSVESFHPRLWQGNLPITGRLRLVDFINSCAPEQKFDSVDALKARILYDADTTRAYFEAQTQRA